MSKINDTSPSSPPDKPQPSITRPPSALSREVSKCMSNLEEITSQLLSDDISIRLRCLTSTLKVVRTPDWAVDWVRCENRFELRPNHAILADENFFLQQEPIVDSSTYIEKIARNLLCTTHNHPEMFVQYQVSLDVDWLMASSGDKAQLLMAVRQIIQAANVESIKPLLKLQDGNERPKVGINSHSSRPKFGEASSTQTRDTEDHLSLWEYDREKSGFGSPSLRHNGACSTKPRFKTTQGEDSPQNSTSRDSASTPTRNTFRAVNYPESDPVGLPFRFRAPEGLGSLVDSSPGRNMGSFSKNDWVKFDFKEAFNSPGLLQEPPINPTEVSNETESISQDATPHDGTVQDERSMETIPIDETPSEQISEPENQKIPLDQEIASPDATLSQTTQILPDDPPYHSDGQPVDQDIKNLIEESVDVRKHVYVLKSPMFFKDGEPCVKIGIAKDVTRRIKELKTSCILEDLQRVRDTKDKDPHHLAWKIEKLAHLELARFQKILKCEKCKSKKVEHQEWFAVPEKVALKVVQRWRRFIELDPYDGNGRLNFHWDMMLTKYMIWPPDTEKSNDHEARDKRWTEWIQKGIDLKES